MAQRLITDRLVLRAWQPDDAAAALGAYGDAEVSRWLTPAMFQVPDEAAMRLVLQQWAAEDARMFTPAGRWAVELGDGGRLIGGAMKRRQCIGSPQSCGTISRRPIVTRIRNQPVDLVRRSILQNLGNPVPHPNVD